MSPASKSRRHRRAFVLLAAPALILAAGLAAPAQAAPVLPLEPPLVLPVPAEENGHAPPAVALRPDGGLVAVWTDLDEGIVGRWFGPPEAGGDAESGEFSISPEYSASYVLDPVMARGSDGDYLAVWSQLVSGAPALVARPFGGEGELRAPAQPVASGPITAMALAARPTGGFLLAWWDGGEDAREIRARFLSPEGFPLGEVVVAGVPEGEHVSRVRTAVAGDGTIAVSWSAYRSSDGAATVRARTFSSGAEPLGPVFDVIPEAASHWIEHDLAAGGSGAFAVAWTRHQASATEVQTLRVRSFLAAGNLGPTHRLDANDAPGRPLARPSLAVGPDGRGVVAWAEGEYGSLRLVARLIFLEGSPRSETFVVDTPPIEADFVNGLDVDRDGSGRLAFGWGFGFYSNVIPTGYETFWSSRARRFQETETDCHPVLSLDFRTEPAAPEAGDPVRLLFEGLADCAEVSLVDWSLDAGAFEVEATAVSQVCGTFPPFPISLPVDVGALDAGDYPVAIDVDLPGGGTCSRQFAFTVEAAPPPPPPPDDPPPPPPDAPPLTSAALPGFRVWVEITSPAGDAVAGVLEPVCIPETLCVSGRLPGRSEVFVRVVGPRPNGRLWPTLVKLTTSTVEVWIEQVSTGEVEYYRLEALPRGVDELPGLFDREGFEP